MRKFLAALCALPMLTVAAPQVTTPISATEMVRRALAAYARDDAAQPQYNYSEREDVRILDGSGNVKRHELRTFDILQVEGSPYRRLVMRNDQPLPAEEEKQQQENLRRGIEERRDETAEQRRARIAEWQRKHDERQGDMNEVPNAFVFKVVGEDVVAGSPVWVIEGTPRPGYKPHCKSAYYFSKLKGRIWITKNDYHAVKIDAVTLDTITIGAFLVRIAQGGHLRVDFERIGSGAWMPMHATINGSARIFFIKGYQLDADYRFSDYKRAERQTTVASASSVR